MASESSVEELAILEETLEALTDGMSEEQQQVMLLKLQQFTNREIAERIGRTQRTVYRILMRTRDRMQELINAESNESS